MELLYIMLIVFFILFPITIIILNIRYKRRIQTIEVEGILISYIKDKEEYLSKYRYLKDGKEEEIVITSKDKPAKIRKIQIVEK